MQGSEPAGESRPVSILGKYEMRLSTDVRVR
jgi:hypothetical protein